MLRSDLMLESDCPELSPLMNRSSEKASEGACCSLRSERGKGGNASNSNKNNNINDEEAKAKTESEAEARAEGGAKGENGANFMPKGKKSNERNRAAYCCWKQVEINTIASGFGHLGPASKTIQRCFLSLTLSIFLYTCIFFYIRMSILLTL